MEKGLDKKKSSNPEKDYPKYNGQILETGQQQPKGARNNLLKDYQNLQAQKKNLQNPQVSRKQHTNHSRTSEERKGAEWTKDWEFKIC